MLNAKEIGSIILASIILGFIISFTKQFTLYYFALGFIAIILVILFNTLAKKLAAYYFDSEIEIKIWSLQRYGFKPHQHFKKEAPIGIFAPLILFAATLGFIKWLAALTFDVKPRTYRAAKRHGLYSYTEMTEYHIGAIAAAGILINLIVAIVSYLLGFEDFSKLNIVYAFYNMFPLSDLDGNRILFGSIILWTFVAALVLIGIGFVYLVY